MKTLKKFLNSPIKIAAFATILIVLLITLSFLVADNVLSQQSSKGLNMENSIDIALSNAGHERNQISNLSATYSNKGSSPVYEIQFSTDTHEFSYTVNAHTGKILSFNKAIIEENPPSSSSNNQAQSGNTTQESNATNSFIELNTAKSIALSDAQLNADDVVFKKTKLDKDDAIYVYEIEFEYQNFSYEYDIDPYTGNILDKEIDD